MGTWIRIPVWLLASVTVVVFLGLRVAGGGSPPPTPPPVAAAPTPTPAPPASIPTRPRLDPPTQTPPRPATTPTRVATSTPAPPPSPASETVDSGASGVEITVQAGTTPPRGTPTASGKGQLVVMLFDGSGKPLLERSVSLRTQNVDIAGRCIAERSMTSLSTGTSGQTLFELDPGTYAVLVDLEGYTWGNMETAKGQCQVPIQAGRTTTMRVRLGQLNVSVVCADGLPVRNQTVQVYRERRNTAGEPVSGDSVASRNNGEIGSVAFDLGPGSYAVAIDLPGYNWGNLQDRKGTGDAVVRAGEVASLDVKLGRIEVRASQGRSVGAYRQRGSGANAARGDSVGSRTVDATGQVSFDLAPGTYSLSISGSPDRPIPDVRVAPGETTTRQ